MKKKGFIVIALILLIINFAMAFPAYAAWERDSIGWWWKNQDGSYPKSGVATINGNMYIFDSNGYLVENQWVMMRSGAWRYCLPGGIVATDRWIDNTYYVDSNGLMMTNAWTPDGYYVDAEGRWNGRGISEIVSPSKESANYSNIVSKKYLVDILEPYQKRGYSTPTEMMMAGETYKKGFLFDHNAPYAIFNLQGKYNILEFDVGQVDGYTPRNATVKIIADGKELSSFRTDGNSIPQHYRIELNGAQQLTIQIAYDIGIWYRYGFANVILY